MSMGTYDFSATCTESLQVSVSISNPGICFSGGIFHVASMAKSNAIASESFICDTLVPPVSLIDTH
jgi:hypothetical protein